MGSHETLLPLASNKDLPTKMEAFHNVFYVTQIRKILTDQDIIIPEIPADLGKNLTLETVPVRIVDRMEKATRKKTIQMIKIIWDYNGQRERLGRQRLG